MLCTLANTFPDFVGRFLDQGLALRRRFSEETVTDLFMGNLMTAAAGKVIVEFPNEPQTGADMEWNFVDFRTGTFFRLVIQAKQAYGAGAIWSRHCYREIYHTSGSGSTLQAQTLCDTARMNAATYPLYLFYHTQSTIDLARSKGIQNIEGVNFADGFQIERLVKGAKGRKLRTQNRSLKTIAPLLSPLSSLFCPPNSLPLPPTAYAGRLPTVFWMQDLDGRPHLGVPMPPAPATIRDRVAAIREAREANAGRIAETETAPEGAYAELPEVPPVSKSIPQDIVEVLEGRGRSSDSEAHLDRWRLTFISTTRSTESG